MKCRFWTTIFKFLLGSALPAVAAAQTLNVAADVTTTRGIRGRNPETVQVNVRFSATPGKDSEWLITSLEGKWNGERLSAENYRFSLNNPGPAPIGRALAMLIPYAAEEFHNIPAPSQSGPLNESLMHELLRAQGFEPDKMRLDGKWVRESADRVTMLIKGDGDGQRIDYRMLLTPDSREITFDYLIILKMPEGDPLTAGLELESSGKGTVSVSRSARSPVPRHTLRD